MNGLIGLTDSFRTTVAGSSVLPQRLSYEFDSVLSCFMFVLVGVLCSYKLFHVFSSCMVQFFQEFDAMPKL